MPGKKRSGSLEFKNGSWWARVTEGRARPWYDLGTADLAKAEQKLARLLADIELRERAPRTSGPRAMPRFEQYAREWLDARRTAGIAQWDSERSWIEKYLLPALGPMLLGDIRPADVRRVMDAAQQAELARQTIVHVRATLRRILKAAWCEELIEENPVDRVPIPRVKRVKKERAILRDEEVLALIECKAVDLEIRLLSLVSRVEGGARTRDLTAWTWPLIDTRTFSSCTIPRTKTLSPQILEIPEILRAPLRAWWKEHGRPKDGPVFPVTRGARKGEARKARGVSFAKRLRRALLVAGVTRKELHRETATTLPADFHSFRRAFSTALANAGINAQQAMRLAGHSDHRAHARYLMTPGEAMPIPASAVLGKAPSEEPAADALARELDRIAAFYGAEREDLIRAVLSVFVGEWEEARGRGWCAS